MGWERKRGKLENLNTILRSGVPEPGTLVVGEPAILGQVKYVITLDEDTQLTLDSARTLVATLAHPLNQRKWIPCQPGERRLRDFAAAHGYRPVRGAQVLVYALVWRRGRH